MKEQPKKPDIKKLDDFPDSVDYCFYLLGYTEGVRGVLTILPEERYKDSYSKGVQDGIDFIDWLFSDAATNEN